MHLIVWYLKSRGEFLVFTALSLHSRGMEVQQMLTCKCVIMQSDNHAAIMQHFPASSQPRWPALTGLQRCVCCAAAAKLPCVFGHVGVVREWSAQTSRQQDTRYQDIHTATSHSCQLRSGMGRQATTTHNICALMLNSLPIFQYLIVLNIYLKQMFSSYINLK